MATETMGRVVLAARLENAAEHLLAVQGRIPADEVHAIEVPDALVDTGETTLAMPKSLINRLDLLPLRPRPARTSAGVTVLRRYGGVRLTVQGRDCLVDVDERPEGTPVLIGRVPLTLLDFVIDPRGQRLIGNPAHDGEQMLEMY